MKNKENIFVHFGGSYAGPAPNEFLNFDASPTLIFERIPLVGKLYLKNNNFFPKNVNYGDIVKGLPVKNNSVKGIYCSHVLEHLTLVEFRKALLNVNKLLKKGGVFRAVLPDLRSYTKKYFNNEISSVEYLKITGLGTIERKRTIRGIIKSIFGNSRHLWMWDYKSITKELLNSGFSEVKEAYYNDSKNEIFKLVEVESRWKDEPVIGFEAIK